MEEQTKQEEQQVPDSVKRANDAVNALKAENERMEKNIKRIEELKAFETLGGKTDGRAQEEPKKELTNEEYADKALRGEIE